MATPRTYPVVVEAARDPSVSRWLWLVKWLLAIPHYFVLALLWLAFVVLTVVAFVAIVVTGRYPRVLFDFTVGVLRWSWRVTYYAYGVLGTDRYPPFTLADVPDYPARLDVEYPERLSRGLVLVKWWLLAIPHYLVLSVFLAGGAVASSSSDNASWQWSSGMGLIGALVLIAAVWLLFSGTYPRGVYDLLLGLNRWVYRVLAYAAGMTDRYPPFRLDMGPTEPEPAVPPTPAPQPPSAATTSAAATAGGPTATALPPGAAPSVGTAGTARTAGTAGGWSAGRVVLVVLGSLVLVAGLGATTAGGVALVADRTQRDGGFLTTGSVDLSTPGYALIADDVRIGGGTGFPDAADVLGDVRIRVTADQGTPVFVGIGSRPAVRAYLSGVARGEVGGPRGDGDLVQVPGTSPAAPPTSLPIWAAQTQGTGTQELRWTPRDGAWAVVVMNADGSPSVAVRGDVGAQLTWVDDVARGVLVLGLLAVLVGALLVVLAVVGAGRRGGARPVQPALAGA
jgi:hypothetical protein